MRDEKKVWEIHAIMFHCMVTSTKKRLCMIVIDFCWCADAEHGKKPFYFSREVGIE